MDPSPSLSSSLKADLTSSRVLKVELTCRATSTAEGNMRLMNSPMSICPSPLMSPRAKMALTSSESNLLPCIISCLLRRPSLSLSIFLKASLQSWRFLKVLLILWTTLEALGLMRAMNSSRVISPSPSISPRLKMASTSTAEKDSPQLLRASFSSSFSMAPSPFLSNLLKAALTSLEFLYLALNFSMISEAEGHIRAMNSS